MGKDWDPSTRLYGDTRSFDGALAPAIPPAFNQIVQDAIAAARGVPLVSPDICVVNFYDNAGKLGLHRDKDESTKSIDQGLPIISVSVGDTAEFLFGDTRDQVSKVDLESGDVLIFGGRARPLFHGISHLKPNTAPAWVREEAGLHPGRLNLTFRQY